MVCGAKLPTKLVGRSVRGKTAHTQKRKKQQQQGVGKGGGRGRKRSRRVKGEVRKLEEFNTYICIHTHAHD